MADLLARFKLIDEMSDKLGKMSESGNSVVQQLEKIGEAANAAFDGMAGGITSASTTIDGVASSLDSLQGVVADTASSADSLSNTMNEYGDVAEKAADRAGEWTDTVAEQEEVMRQCERVTEELSNTMEKACETEEKLSEAMEKASKVSEELADQDKVSAKAKEELSKASQKAEEAMAKLTAAQQEAEAAMAEYETALASGKGNLNELEQAAERAAHSAETLAEANNIAGEATSELAKATEQATKEAENGEQSGVGAVEGVAGALAAAGITAKVYEIATAVYDLAEGFTEAEKTIIAATGATGQELDKLTASALNVFASSSAENLNDVAVAMTTVRTSTGLTEQALEDATSSALVLNKVLGYEFSESSRTAGALMKNFGLTADEAYNLIVIGAQQGADKNGDLLDILNEYSAQYAALGLSAEEFMSSLIDGAKAGVFSVDKVGDAVKEFNIRAKDGSETSAEAFELLGMNADRMSAKFATGGETARAAFFEVVNALNSMSDPMEKNAAAVGLFGTMYEDLEANILPVLANVEGGTMNMYDALGTVTNQAQSLGDKWQQAGNSISTAFAKAVEPAISATSSTFADLAKEVGDFLNEYPAVTKIITALGVGIGVVVTGLALYTAGSAVATAATALFGTTLSVAIWPITLIAAAIAAVTAAVLFLVDAFEEDMGATEGMTAVTREQYYELQNLNDEYEEACKKYGETSEEASRLKYEVNDLEAAFEANQQTVEEFNAEVDALCESASQVTKDFDEGMKAIKSSETASFALIQKYEDLATQAELTGAQQKELEAVTKKLSETYPDLTSQLENATLSAEDYVEAMKKACEQEAEELRQQQAQESYVEMLAKRAELTEEIEKAQKNLNKEQARMDDMSGWDHFWTTGEWDDLENYQAKMDELNKSMKETEATITEIEQGWSDLAAAEEAAAEEGGGWEEAVSTAYESVREDIEELCAAYEEAYEAALESFSGQFGLFDEASMKSEEYTNATVENAQKALESQLSYWETYNANLQTLTEYGKTLTGEARENYAALLAYAQDGSEEAAGLASNMAAAIKSGDEQAIATLSDTMGKVMAKRDEIASATADWQTNFTAQMDQYAQDMANTVNEMDLSDEAKVAATSTINSYAESIKAGKAEAVAAAEEVANSVSSALKKTNASVNVNVNSAGTAAPAHANGTTHAESMFIAGEAGPELIVSKAAAYATGTTNSDEFYIAGENGPELIIGQQGSTVFPTSETDRLINALNSKAQPLEIQRKSIDTPDNGGSVEQVKRIMLEIAGSGTIEVGGSGGADKETILEVLYEHLKPALMNLIQGEIYEEGELSYEY